ncbi:hypothetical protein [Nannocystis punicea]|uniref:Dickkopf N-terminal cysteine-rich domain-containing protein n=1 Tax=Nannocystis punicea TaxID=2995304 RepID=A0ABY7H5H8_9BACT|nr:hypothetical protein [Nannocystis poenicansa]WAS94447.1 hypothetical protein O0S08_50670 [Nannocystis poenicansa]
MCPTIATIAEDEFAARFAAAICDQKAACGCGGGADCVAALEPRFEAVLQYARDNSLQYDAACATELLTGSVLHRGCGLESDYYGPVFECGGRCKVFRGDIPSGGACTRPENDVSAYVHECAAADEYCQGEGTLTCQTYDLPTMQLGETCMDAEYNDLGWCAEELWCSFESLVCVPLVGEGEACGAHAECSVDLFCGAGVCRRQRPGGDACEDDLQCGSSVCLDGACRDEPVICLVDSPSDLRYSFTLRP